MLGFFHKALTAAAAILVSAGYAVCACLSVAAPTVSAHDGYPPAFAHTALHDDTARGPGGDIHDGHGGGPHSPVDHSTCKHCAQAALAKPSGANDAKASGEKAGGGAVPALSPAPFQPSSAAIMSRQFLRWAAPPDPSPISLKIRLLI